MTTRYICTPSIASELTAPSPPAPSPIRYELGRQPAHTKLSSHVDVRVVRCRGGNKKFRALRLDHGNFSWGSENVTRKARILDVCYNASNNELVRTKTLVKGAVIAIDALRVSPGTSSTTARRSASR